MRLRSLLVVLGLTVAIIAALAAGGHLGDLGPRVRAVLTTVADADPLWVGLALVLLGLSTFVRAVRWFALIHRVAPLATIPAVFSSTIIGFTAVVLFGRPGELVRPFLIARRSRSPFSSQAAAWVLERVWDLLAVILIFAGALTQVRVDPAHLSPGLQWVLHTGGTVALFLGLVSFLVILVLGFLSEPRQARVLQYVRRLPHALAARLERVIVPFLTGMASARRPSQIGALGGLTVLEWTMISAQTYAILQAFPPTAHLGTIDALVFLGFVAFGSVVQVPGIGGGVQVAGAVVLAELFGLGLESATAVAIGYWLLSWVALVPAGLLAALMAGVSWRSLRHLEEPEVRSEAGDSQSLESAAGPPVRVR